MARSISSRGTPRDGDLRSQSHPISAMVDYVVHSLVDCVVRRTFEPVVSDSPATLEGASGECGEVL